MKKTLIVFALFAVASLFAFAQPQAEDVLTVYAYDSFTGDWGAGNDIVAAFQEKTGIKVNLVGCSGAVQMYSKVLFEGEQCPADVVIGLSDTTDIDTSLFLDWTPECEKNLVIDNNDSLVAFDYGIFAFIADMQYFADRTRPTCLWDLTDEEYKGKVILIDPRTSSVGLGLLLWTIEELGEQKAFEWWALMKKNALTIADSWSSGYGLFTEGEAPLVISYTTSPVYHVMYEDTTRYQALEFDDGHLSTVEYLGILKTSKHQDWASQFCEFVLTEGQEEIAVTNTMFPANGSVALPQAFDYALMPSKVDNCDYTQMLDSYLNKWSQIMVL